MKEKLTDKEYYSSYENKENKEKKRKVKAVITPCDITQPIDNTEGVIISARYCNEKLQYFDICSIDFEESIDISFDKEEILTLYNRLGELLQHTGVLKQVKK